MNISEIKKILEENLNQEPSNGKVRNIVFWYDGESEFVEDIKSLELENAKILQLTDNNKLYIKYLLEKEDIESNYLIYSPKPRPVPRENWLLDIEKYSEEFSTDKATVIMRNLGVKDETLRNVFKKYIKFFGNKERYGRFASYNIEVYTEEKIDIAVLSTLCKLQMADFELVTKTLLIEEIEEKNKIKEDIEKFGDMDVFWNILEKQYGYHLEEKSLEQLMIMFLITNLSYKLEAKIPTAWERFVSSKRADTIVFIDHFMSHSIDSKSYNKISNHIGQKLNIREYISKWDIEDYIECDTFKDFDDEIITTLITSLVENVGEYEKYRKIINKRRTSHWFSQLSNEYDAIYYAMEILRLEKELEKNIKGTTAYEIVDNYTKSYYLFDTFYRKFYISYDRIDDKEKFYKLMEVVENTYTNWYLEELSIRWSGLVEDELKDDIRISGLTKQQEFYETYIAPHMRKDERVFVIISDALRYEAAKEFSDIINRDRQGKSEIFFMQGVIPSYTKLGMASLLPHKKIEISDNGDIVVDGINSSGTINRGKILFNHIKESVAIQYNDVKDMKRAEYKENFGGKRLIYIYHDVIDAIGDKASTERDVFEGVEKTIDDLNNLIKSLIHNVSATNIYITADHGFIYRRSSLQEFDKMARLDVKAMEQGRRYILTEEKLEEQGIVSLSMKYLLGEGTSLNAIIPKGVTRFKMQGAGDNYVHGGVALQEIMIPVIKYKNIRKEEFKSSKVEVKLTNISRKITNRITYLEFFQTEKVEDKKIPIALKLYFVDEEGNRISNENIIIADSRSSKPEDRTFREKFTLKDQAYDKSKKYYLIMEDENETVEKIYDKVPFMIDLAIINDFGF
ncbi:BREX-1 system phosphatase PglZ type A [Clostridium cochlearium]|uniref:BREX-1 system phosphatase PglZ type A n=1 Tax=Clostridium cochlearium TaxID=1494 RepID=UPI001EDD4D49|nr:BREX-1 system phosphatase PglZ type A [Clostridium cochlearium]MBV1818011.1 BREX-1 system phosphatase PglZ type A [Bacteroidales bacterium MSK.15.36]MCG4580092.1 BREX-1 system phosphatase PglZ type A [Clostridium cochlearium]